MKSLCHPCLLWNSNPSLLTQRWPTPIGIKTLPAPLLLEAREDQDLWPQWV